MTQHTHTTDGSETTRQTQPPNAQAMRPRQSPNAQATRQTQPPDAQAMRQTQSPNAQAMRPTQSPDLRVLAEASRDGQLRRIFAVPDEVLAALEDWADALASAGKLERAWAVAEGVVALDGTREGAAAIMRRVENARRDAEADVSATNQGGEG